MGIPTANEYAPLVGHSDALTGVLMQGETVEYSFTVPCFNWGSAGGVCCLGIFFFFFAAFIALFIVVPVMLEAGIVVVIGSVAFVSIPAGLIFYFVPVQTTYVITNYRAMKVAKGRFGSITDTFVFFSCVQEVILETDRITFKTFVVETGKKGVPNYLQFTSLENVEFAYDVAQRVHKAGIDPAWVKNAQHVQSNNWTTDLSSGFRNLLNEHLSQSPGEDAKWIYVPTWWERSRLVVVITGIQLVFTFWIIGCFMYGAKHVNYAQLSIPFGLFVLTFTYLMFLMGNFDRGFVLTNKSLMIFGKGLSIAVPTKGSTRLGSSCGSHVNITTISTRSVGLISATRHEFTPDGSIYFGGRFLTGVMPVPNVAAVRQYVFDILCSDAAPTSV